MLRDAGAVVRVDRLPVVHGDAVQLRALLQNLIANAAKFRRPGVAPRIVLSSRRVDDRWQVEVSDNGTGVAPDSASGSSSCWPAARGWPPRAAASAWPPASASSRPTAARSACTTPRTVGRACGWRCRWWTDGEGRAGPVADPVTGGHSGVAQHPVDVDLQHHADRVLPRRPVADGVPLLGLPDRGGVGEHPDRALQ